MLLTLPCGAQLWALFPLWEKGKQTTLNPNEGCQRPASEWDQFQPGKGFLAKAMFRKHVFSCRNRATNLQCWSDITDTLHQAAHSSYTIGKAKQCLAFPLERKCKCFWNDGVYLVGLYSVVLAAFPIDLLEPLHVCSLLSSRIILVFWLRCKTAVLPICNPLEIL